MVLFQAAKLEKNSDIRKVFAKKVQKKVHFHSRNAHTTTPKLDFSTPFLHQILKNAWICQIFAVPLHPLSSNKPCTILA